MRGHVLSCVLVFVLAALVPAYAQQVVDDAINRLGQIADTDAGQWRFQHPAQPGGDVTGVDDSDWPSVRPEHRWDFPDSEAWYRKHIVVPRTIGSVSVEGSGLVLKCAVDDDMEIFVNGQSRGRFHWDEGDVLLAESVSPGDEFTVAVRAINGPGNGRLLSAALEYTIFADCRELAAQYRNRLQFCKRLIATKRAADKRGEYTAILDTAAAGIDFDAISRRDKAGFEGSLERCLNALEPLSRLAKQYTIFLVGHAHIDMNWLWLWPETKQVCRMTWDQALKFMDEFPDFKFTQSQPGAYIAIEEECPELFARIKAAVDRGQWELAGASWVEGDTNMASGEALARQCLLADRYFTGKFGQRSELAWLPDNFGHAWTVPSIFADAGYKYFYFCRAGKNIPTFWWEGPDGQRLLAYSHRWYNEQFRLDRALVPLEVDDSTGVPACMIVYGVGDHGGGPTRIDIETARSLQDDPLFPNIKFAKTTDYFQAALDSSGGELPRVQDELNFTFEGCYTTHSDVKRWNRESENALPAAETIAAIASNWGGEYPSQGLTQAWRNTCFNQFHDILPGSAIHESYDYSRELYQQAMLTTQSTVEDGLASLSAQIDTQGDGQAFIVWNPVAWDRNDWIELAVASDYPWPRVTVTDSEGASFPGQVLASEEKDGRWESRVQLIAQLPSLGYEVFHAKVEPGDATPAIGGKSLAVDAEKGLPLTWTVGDGESIEVATGLEILHEATHGMSAWTIGDITGSERPTLESAKVIADGPVCRRLALRYTYRESSFDLTVTDYSALNRTDFDLVADWQEVGNSTDGGPFLKAFFRLPEMDTPRPTFEIPWGSIERPANGREVPAQKWVDVADAERVSVDPSRQPRAIDLSDHFNQDAVATPAAPADGDFDDGQRAYSAEIFGDSQAGTLTIEDVPFIVPPTGPGALNCVRAEGQVIEWPAQSCSALAVFGASSNGRHGGTAQLLYADGAPQTVALEFSDWCFGPGAGETSALQAPYRLDSGAQSGPTNYIWLKRLGTDAGRKLKGIVLPDDPNLHIFGMAFAQEVAYRAKWGVSLLNDCKYGFDVKDNQLRMSLLRASYNPDPLPDQGLHRIRYALYPHSGDWRQAQTARRAFEFNNRPIVRAVTGHAGTLPSRYSFVRVEPDEMILSAFKPAEDGRGYVARVYNACGVGGQARIVCNLPFKQAVACNLLEQPRERNTARVDGPVVTLDLEGRLHGTVSLTE